MPYQEKEIEKLYYTISEVAERFNVNPSLIRFWEKEFPILKPKKNKKGNRLFTKEDIEHFHRIYTLVKEDGYTLQGAKEKLKNKRAEERPAAAPLVDTPVTEVVAKLERIKEDLEGLRASIQQVALVSEPTRPASKSTEIKKEPVANSDISPNQISLFD